MIITGFNFGNLAATHQGKLKTPTMLTHRTQYSPIIPRSMIYSALTHIIIKGFNAYEYTRLLPQ